MQCVTRVCTPIINVVRTLLSDPLMWSRHFKTELHSIKLPSPPTVSSMHHIAVRLTRYTTLQPKSATALGFYCWEATAIHVRCPYLTCRRAQQMSSARVPSRKQGSHAHARPAALLLSAVSRVACSCVLGLGQWLVITSSACHVHGRGAEVLHRIAYLW